MYSLKYSYQFIPSKQIYMYIGKIERNSLSRMEAFLFTERPDS